MTDEKKQEFTLRISQANQSQLIVILYELFFFYIEEAERYSGKNSVAFGKELGKAHDCLGELIASLHTDHENEQVRKLAGAILKVYFFVSARLGAAMGSGKKEPLADAVIQMRRLYEIYKKDAKNDTTGPVMGHTQTVYAGLTYGKSNLNVSCEDGGAGRGFYA